MLFSLNGILSLFGIITGYYIMTEAHGSGTLIVYTKLNVATDYKYSNKNLLCFSFDPIVVATLDISIEYICAHIMKNRIYIYIYIYIHEVYDVFEWGGVGGENIILKYIE